MGAEPKKKKSRKKRKKQKKTAVQCQSVPVEEKAVQCQSVPIFCHCGRKQQMGIKGDVFACESVCAKMLPCGHRCVKGCHSGSCGKCAHMYTKSCLCKKTSKDIFCGEEDHFQCDLKCGRQLACGHHECESICHSPPCAPCALLPSKVRFCLCGKTPLYRILFPNESRKWCTDPIPTCDKHCKQRMGRPSVSIGAYYMSNPTPRPYPQSRFNLESSRIVQDIIPKEELQSTNEIFKLRFKTTSSYRRRIIHLIAPKFGCTSLSYGAPPNRYTVASTTRLLATFPSSCGNSASSVLKQSPIFIGNRFYKRRVIL